MKPSYLTGITTVLLLAFASMPAAADEWDDYDDIGPTLQAYEDAYPAICERHDLGLSVQGRHLWAIRITDNIGVEEDEPEFKYISTMHGNEPHGTKMCMLLIDYLLTNYGGDPQVTNIVDEIDIWILPLMNPDGYDRASPIRLNANGVDLNRDFPEGTHGDPNTTAGRADETAVVMNWSFANSFTLAANFHTGTVVVNYPFDNDGMGSVPSPTPDDDMFIYISEEYSQHNLPMWNSPYFYHGITNGADWYSIDGGMQDWSYRYMGCNEVTIELSDDQSPPMPPTSDIPIYWDDNRDSMLAYMETCLIGVRGLVTDGASGAPLEATVTVVGRDHEVYTDLDVGDYHRMLMPGTYDLTFEVDGYDPVTVTNVVVNSGDATRLDVQMYGAPGITSPNGGETLSAGVETSVTWTGNPEAQFHVQYTENSGDLETTTDGFERNSLGPDYASGGDADWFITTSAAHSGSRSARAGDIGDNNVSWMTRTAGEGALSFWYRVSSESGWDYFNFYIDGDRKLHVSGDVSWTLYSTTLSAGSHELKWEYDKDGSATHGSDTVWIDDLEVTADNTTWTDVIALTTPGATSTPWTPMYPGDAYKVRVRSYKDGAYGDWDESDATFEVEATGDFEPDGDVDLADFAAFQMCLGTAPSGACSAGFDLDADGDVDLTDLASFIPLLEASGPGN